MLINRTFHYFITAFRKIFTIHAAYLYKPLFYGILFTGMYRKFYNIREKPFNITSDPNFLYLSRRHKEALSHLIYGIEDRKGFLEITGEVGTGKTTLCRALLNKVDQSTKTAFVLTPDL